MKGICKTALLGLALSLFGGIAAAEEVTEALTNLAKSDVQHWLNKPAVWNHVKAQNARNRGLSEAEIVSLDKQWRAETGASSHPLIDKVLASELSAYLNDIKEKSGGMYTEIFVMDSVGLNVGQSDVTSDYWQGDEAKWQKTFKAGPDSIHIGEVELDESTQQLQVQLSLPVVENGSVIGAVTIGVNVDAL